MAYRVEEVSKSIEIHGYLPESTGEFSLGNRLRAGESEAIRILFNTYFDSVYSFIYHNVDRDHNITEDIVQETFLNAIKSARRFKGKSHVYTWLIGIARHKIGDYYRLTKKEHSRSIRPQGDLSQDSEELMDNSTSIEESLELDQDNLAVEQTLRRLPFHYRQVLWLKYVEELSVINIGQIMGRSSKSIEGLLYRAREAFKESLGENQREKQI